MTIQVDRNFIVKSPSGQTIVINGNTDQIVAETTVRYVCASPRCAARHDQIEPQSIFWVEEEVKADPSRIPPTFKEWLHLVQNIDNGANEYVLCGPGCARDFIQYQLVPARTLPPAAPLTEIAGEPTSADLDATVNAPTIAGVGPTITHSDATGYSEAAE